MYVVTILNKIHEQIDSVDIIKEVMGTNEDIEAPNNGEGSLFYMIIILIRNLNVYKGYW